ncbi:hypothetical protein PILCRDRAFT_68487, partial [Piloderma croceum F 1598]
IHGQTRAGIHGSTSDGAYSVVLSGGYDEDEDKGDTFVYTGSGGIGSKDPDELMQGWNPAQTEHQSFENRYNKSLQISSVTKRPVRVIRGFFKDKKDRTYDSPYAPAEGYRYDGLYIVDRAYMKDGKSKYRVCAFDFRVSRIHFIYVPINYWLISCYKQRIEGQPPVPIRGRSAV